LVAIVSARYFRYFRQKEKPTVSSLLAVGICMPDLNLFRLSQQPPCARRHVGATTTNAGNSVVARHREPDSMRIETHLSNKMSEIPKRSDYFGHIRALLVTFHRVLAASLRDFHRTTTPNHQDHGT
jgi:hypothetical protein